jgi:probable F420-dependent oxidoreductase
MELEVYSFGHPLEHIGALARDAEQLGFSAMWFTESKHNPYLGCAVAATVTERLTVGTGIAVAFPRSPMVTAQAAWDLAGASDGRFILGLGTQVKAHIERRFSAPFDKPVPRLREYICALRAIFRAFQGEEKLSFDGDFYRFSLLTEFFSAGPIAHPDIPIYVAGVNRRICEMTGEVADGLHVHPFHSRDYLTSVVRPAIARGADRAGRDPAAIALACPVFMIVGDDEEEIEPQRSATRRQLAFYGSTRTYAPVFEQHGFGHAPGELHRLMARGELEAMERVITDEMLDLYAVTATWDELPQRLIERYDGVVDRVFPYAAQGTWTASPETRERWGDVAARVRAGANRRVASGTN